MSTRVNKLKITGRPYSIRGSLVFIAAISFAMAFMLMGTAFPHLFAVLFIVLAGFNMIILMLLRWTNWLEFDDENKSMLRVFRQRISYDKVQAIFISQFWNGYSIKIKTGRLQTYPLISGLNKSESVSAENEFAKRFRPSLIHKESYRRKLVIIAAIFSLILAILAINFFYTSSRLVALKSVAVEKRDWLASSRPAEGRQYSINGINFLLPDNLSQSKRENSWIYFDDSITKVKVKAGPGLLQDTGFKRGSFFAYVTGIQDDYDFLRLGYTARFGLFPTMNNSTTFRNLLDVKLYELDRGSFRGIVLQGMRGSKSVAEIVVTNGKRGIQFFISQPGEAGKLKEDLLQSIVASIQTAD